jgi:hypothetical protein
VHGRMVSAAFDAYDPKQTLDRGSVANSPLCSQSPLTDQCQYSTLRSQLAVAPRDAIRPIETARVHIAHWRRGGVANSCARAAAGMAQS